jgi:N-acetylglutamate synthase-like GNAT family acetyltransferase
MAVAASHLVAMPLAAWERDGLAAALQGVGLPTDDVADPNRLFWRFETAEMQPVGFGGLEILKEDALLRSIVTLPPVRHRGIGAAIVALLEEEARRHRCDALWLLTTSAKSFFDRLGFAACDRAVVPEAVRSTRQFAALCPDSAVVMMKRLA